MQETDQRLMTEDRGIQLAIYYCLLIIAKQKNQSRRTLRDLASRASSSKPFFEASL